jgi:erythromycin esterase
VAGPWPNTARPTFVVPGSRPDERQDVALGRTFDIVVHLHRVNASLPMN